ncbi:MAG: PspC domain-containing protein [Oscillospiraceae bacterium]|nr:PspC domain-containing protein [Oscillospiraceae bacterium]
MEPRRLYRSQRNRIIAGVCGGIGEYFNIDPIIVRVLAIVIPGFGWIAYLLCALIIPSE